MRWCATSPIPCLGGGGPNAQQERSETMHELDTGQTKRPTTRLNRCNLACLELDYVYSRLSWTPLLFCIMLSTILVFWIWIRQGKVEINEFRFFAVLKLVLSALLFILSTLALHKDTLKKILLFLFSYFRWEKNLLLPKKYLPLWRNFMFANNFPSSEFSEMRKENRKQTKKAESGG